MKRLAWILVLPLTVISFTLFTKWWFVLPVDAPDNVMKGFPLIYTGSAFYTSGAQQFFIIELLFDLLCYSAFWFGLIYFFNRYVYQFKKQLTFTTILFITTCVLFVLQTLMVSMPDNVFRLKRDIKTQEVMDSGFYFELYPPKRPNYSDYHPERRR